MFDIVGKRRWYFLISACVIVPGLAAMVYSTIAFGTPVRMSIDFTGGVLLELKFEQAIRPAEVRQVFVERGYGDTAVQTTADERTVLIRSKPLGSEVKAEIEAELEDKFGPLEELRFESVGPTIGHEVTRAAGMAVMAASAAILGFIIWAFRRVPHAFRYGTCAILAMVHDVLVALGFFSIMGLIRGWEMDALFFTAILTVIGFSVQDTIVVFDRIRENIPKRRREPFETVVNRSILETIHRSLATQLSAIFVMIAILLFGGSTVKRFVATILVGVLSGTYSSIFTAVPLLVVWEKGEVGQIFRRLRGREVA
ncbi:MAG: protein translocase subunit SecF [Chloroflexota bacterium]|nr:protein translocase subunit SecF [Chloroflexota bacterium]